MLLRGSSGTILKSEAALKVQSQHTKMVVTRRRPSSVDSKLHDDLHDTRQQQNDKRSPDEDPILIV